MDIPDQLEAGINFLIYAGDCGFICNWLGNKAWALELKWSGNAAFNAAKDVPWTYTSADGHPAQGGIVRSANGFTFLQVRVGACVISRDATWAFIAGAHSGFVGTLHVARRCLLLATWCP